MGVSLFIVKSIIRTGRGAYVARITTTILQVEIPKSKYVAQIYSRKKKILKSKADVKEIGRAIE